MAKQTYTKWIRQYANGVWGSLSNSVNPSPFHATPLQVYKPGVDIYPNHGFLICWNGIPDPSRQNNIPTYLWEIDVDVADVKISQLVAPNCLNLANLQQFWKDPEAFIKTTTTLLCRVPANTVFCSRVKLIRNLTEEFEHQNNEA